MTEKARKAQDSMLRSLIAIKHRRGDEKRLGRSLGLRCGLDNRRFSGMRFIDERDMIVVFLFPPSKSVPRSPRVQYREPDLYSPECSLNHFTVSQVGDCREERICCPVGKLGNNKLNVPGRTHGLFSNFNWPGGLFWPKTKSTYRLGRVSVRSI